MTYRYTFTVSIPFEVGQSLPDGTGALAKNPDGTYTFTRNGQAVTFSSATVIPTGPGVLVQRSAG